MLSTYKVFWITAFLLSLAKMFPLVQNNYLEKLRLSTSHNTLVGVSWPAPLIPLFSPALECLSCVTLSFDSSKFLFCRTADPLKQTWGWFSLKYALKKKSLRHPQKSVMFTNSAQHCPHERICPIVSHKDALLECNVCNRSIMQQAHCCKILGCLVLNNTNRICEWHSCKLPLIKNDFWKLLPRLRGDLSNPVI